MKKYVLIIVLLVSVSILFAQVESSSELFRQLKVKDSLVFNIGFNTCDIIPFEDLVSDDFEFYHDQGGLTPSKKDFIASLQNGLFKLSYRARRELDESTLMVFPLEKNGELYGAIQTGIHRFFAMEKDKPEYLSSVARFTHVWLIENGEWKLSRVLSYDHE